MNKNAPIGGTMASASYMTSARVGKGGFCCTDGGIKIGCSLGGAKNSSLNTNSSSPEKENAQAKCVIF